MAPGLQLDDTSYVQPLATPDTKLDKLSKGADILLPTLAGDRVWSGATLRENEYTHYLTPEEKTEINAALNHFKSLELEGNEVCRDNFPLPSLGEKLLRFAEDVHSGRGFVNIRGLNPQDYSAEDNILLFLGVSSYIGEKRARQDEEGNMLAHVTNAKDSKEAQEDRPTRYSNRASTFHTDTFCDVLALQTRSNAVKGGNHLIASSAKIYNILAKTRPDVLELLVRPIWSFDSRGSLFDCNTRPLLFFHHGQLILNFSREPLLGLKGVARTAGLPELTEPQREALDLIESLARENQLSLPTEPGDLTFINNHAVLHSREAFEDAPGSVRYLVRMWLKNPALAWKLPRQLQIGNSRIYDDEELDERWNLVDAPRIKFNLSQRLCS